MQMDAKHAKEKEKEKNKEKNKEKEKKITHPPPSQTYGGDNCIHLTQPAYTIR